MTAPMAQAGPPPVMNRPAIPPRPPQVIYYQPAPPRLMPIQQLLGIALLAGFGLVGITAGVLRLVKRFIGPIFNSIAKYQSDRYNQRSTLLSRLNKTLSELKPKEDNQKLLESHETLGERVESVVELADRRVRAMNMDEPYKEFRNKLSSLKDAITNPDYTYSSYSQFGSYGYNPGRMNNSNDSPAVQSFKSEIRSFKGMLLNRRNFPMANTSTTTSRPASPATSTTPATPATPVRDVPQYHPRRRESYRSELNNTTTTPPSTSSPPASTNTPTTPITTPQTQ
ncbi:hypothetical protein BDA99DRAFT_517186 [Phascolomyces articulosus]|uniref:Peroxin-14 n=1 Tax=Phascolomyces articulosus TaxID=60185 RepID=A0AAD5JUX2_9FUNG|nr:hypothetical protein BDA99DRAFT_517186 [Phascolomyces articulosus]